MTAATDDQSSSSLLNEPITGLNEKQERIYAYLCDKAESQTYFKSRDIAAALGLSAKEVGVNITSLREADTPLNIEKWGYSSSTTWMITQDE